MKIWLRLWICVVFASVAACSIGKATPETLPYVEITDVVMYPPAAQLDLLYVLSTTPAMKEELPRFLERMRSLLTYIDTNHHQLDLHVGLISSDLSDPSQSGRLIGKVPYVHFHYRQSAAEREREKGLLIDDAKRLIESTGAPIE